MKHFMSLNARHELIEVTAPRYQQGNRLEKQQILNEFVQATGYHRKYAITILGKWVPKSRSARKKSPRIRSMRYDESVYKALVIIWKAANCICSKRIVPCIPLYIDALERFGHLTLTDTVRDKLLQISPSTIDRLLKSIRQGSRPRGVGMTKPGELLKKQIPIRTFADWNENQPGFVEADLVAHCGPFVAGSFLHTLTMTDVATGWTECTGLLVKDQQVT